LLCVETALCVFYTKGNDLSGFSADTTVTGHADIEAREIFVCYAFDRDLDNG
jgi:hypothetical protein